MWGEKSASAVEHNLRGLLQNLALLVMLFATSCATCKSAENSQMKKVEGTMAGVTMMRLGKAETGVISASHDGEQEMVSPIPYVLWNGDRPIEAIIQRRNQSFLAGWITERLERVIGEGGPFPVKNRVLFVYGVTKEVDAYESTATTADINGDGIDELIFFRQRRSVEAYNLQKRLFELELPKGYILQSQQRVRIDKAEELYLVFDLDSDSNDKPSPQSPRSILVHVDANGAKRLKIPEPVLAGAKITALAAINRQGSNKVDELLSIFSRDETEFYLGRHWPDGEIIEMPRKIEIPFSTSVLPKIIFLKHSEKMVLHSKEAKRLYFIEPVKRTGWIVSVDLEQIDSYAPDLLQVMENGGDPLAILVRNDKIYGVNQRGACVTWNGKEFVESSKVEAFVTLPHLEGNENLPRRIYGVDDTGNEFLAISSRKKSNHNIGFDEAMEAAEKFLEDRALNVSKKSLEPDLNEDADRGSNGERLIKKEQLEKGIARAPQNNEEWKRLFPDSYQAVSDNNRNHFVNNIFSDLKIFSKNKKEAMAWIEAHSLPSETSFEYYHKGDRIGSFKIPGVFPFDPKENNSIEFRPSANGLSVILPIQNDETGKDLSGLVLIDWNGAN